MQKIEFKQTFSIKHCHCDTFNRFSRTVNSLNCFSIIILVSYSHSIYFKTVSSSSNLAALLNWFKLAYTECPTQMGTTSDSIFYFLKPHISKSKTCLKILVKKSFRWHLETWESQIGSISN